MQTKFGLNRRAQVRRGAILSLAFAAVCTFSRLPGEAQVTGGSISGTVVDASQSAVPRAHVAAMNTATGVVSYSVTNNTGYYEFPLMLPGNYAVRVEAPGFSQARTSSFEVLTGQRASINITLKVGSVTQSVNVSAAATQLLNVTTPAMGTEVSPAKIKNLPLNQRNFFPLIGLQPGVNADSGANTLNGKGGFEVNGAPGLSNNVLIDGVDGTFGEDNGLGAGSGTIINTLSVDAIGEFRTPSSVPPAEYGRATGGILTITTKSGTNAFHGTAYEFIRNDAFDANTWENKHVLPIVPLPELRYNDFGANLGGPIRRDRAFFFFNYEGDRVVSQNTVSGDTPEPSLISSVSNPAIAEELSFSPPPVQSTSNPYIGYYVGNRATTNDENTYVGRVDTTWGAHHLMARFNYNNQLQRAQEFRASNYQSYPETFENAALEDAWTIGPDKVNELRLGLNRNLNDRSTTAYFNDPTQAWISLKGFFNSDVAQNQLYAQTTTYGLVDNFIYIHSRHTLTFGTDNRFVPSRRTQQGNPEITYATIPNLQTDTPSNLKVSFGGGMKLFTWQWALYAQDNYRVTPHLTLTYGLRYDYFTPLRGKFNVIGDSPFGPFDTNKNDPMSIATRFDFSPRTGLVFDVLDNRKLIFRAGFGLMFVPIQPSNIYNEASVNPLLPYNAQFLPSQVPAGFSVKYPISQALVKQIEANPSLIPPGLSFGRDISQYHRPDQYSENWNANLQYQFTPSLYTQIAYVGLNDLHEQSVSAPNQYIDGTCSTPACPKGILPEPALGVIQYTIFGGITQYNSLQASVDWRHGTSSADLYYTYSSQNQTWDTTDTIGNAIPSELQNPNDGHSAQGPSDGFERHRLKGIYIISPPTPAFARHNALGRGLLGGFSFQGIVNFNSGQAFNILANADLVRNGWTSGTRPDHVPGTSFYASGKQINSQGYRIWLNTAAFDATTPYNEQRYGNLGFNAVYGPKSASFDASVIKHIATYREHNLDFRAEFFNVLNLAELDSPTGTMTDPNFGVVTTRSDPRNVQFGLKYTF